MKKQSGIWLFLRPQKDLYVFVLEPGMDIFVPIFIWPNYLASTKLDQDMMIADMRVTKKVLIDNHENCEGSESYRYAGS